MPIQLSQAKKKKKRKVKYINRVNYTAQYN